MVTVILLQYDLYLLKLPVTKAVLLRINPQRNTNIWSILIFYIYFRLVSAGNVVRYKLMFDLADGNQFESIVSIGLLHGM